MRTGCMSLLFVVVASSAFAQSPDPRPGVGNPAFAPPPAPKGDARAREAGRFNDADRLFLREAALDTMSGAEVARLGEQKRTGVAIAQFAGEMTKDHAAFGRRLDGLTKEADMSAPAALDRARAATLDDLRASSGPAFDRRFWTYQLAEHQKAAQLLSYEIGSGLDPTLRGLASEVLPTVLRRLRHIQENVTTADRRQ